MKGRRFFVINILWNIGEVSHRFLDGCGCRFDWDASQEMHHSLLHIQPIDTHAWLMIKVSANELCDTLMIPSKLLSMVSISRQMISSIKIVQQFVSSGTRRKKKEAKVLVENLTTIFDDNMLHGKQLSYGCARVMHEQLARNSLVPSLAWDEVPTFTQQG